MWFNDICMFKWSETLFKDINKNLQTCFTYEAIVCGCFFFFFFGFVYVLKNNKIKKLLLEPRRLSVAQLNALKNIKGRQLHGKITRYSPDDIQ